MRIGIKNREFVFFFLTIFCLIHSSCGQANQDKKGITLKYENEASLAREKGNLETAIEKQSKVVEINPEDAKKRAVLASLYIEKYDKEKNSDDLKNAKQQLKEAIRIEPNNPIIHNALALVFEKEGNYEELLEENKKIVELDSNNLQNLTNLGIAYLDNNDKESARKIFDEVIDKNPNFIYGLYHYGEFEFEQSNTEKAKELFDRAVKSNSQSGNSDSKYVELSRKRLEELKGQKAMPN